MTIPRRLRQHLDEAHISYEPIFHLAARSSEHIAATLHIPGIEMAKAVVLLAGEKPVLAVLPSSYHINLNRLAAVIGIPVRLADKAECQALFPDCEQDAVPPFGELYGLSVYLDQALADEPEMVFSAGTLWNAVRMGNLDFVRLTKPRICSFAEKPGRKG